MKKSIVVFFITVVIGTIWYIMHVTSNNRIDESEFLQGIAVILLSGSIGIVGMILKNKPENIINVKSGKFSTPLNSDLETNDAIEKRNFEVPSICPHCKNPNTKKIRLCEWCGNQIC